MKYILLLISALGVSFAASAEPARFNWKSLQGFYDYVSCTGENPAWPAQREKFYIQIFQPADKPWENTLHMMLLRRDQFPMALIYSMHAIDEGVYYDQNPETKIIYSTETNVTTETALEGTESWDWVSSGGYRAYGRSSIRLSRGEDGLVKYELMIQHQDNPEGRETCILKRQGS